MKYIILSILLGTLFIGCKKASIDHASVASSIVGTWELRHLVGGLQSPGNNPDYPPGNGNILNFSDSSYYYYYPNGQLRGNGSYSLVKDTCVATGQYMDGIIFDRQSYSERCFEIKNNILTLYRGIVAADRTIETYERIYYYPL